MLERTTRSNESNNYNNLIVILVIHVRQQHVAYRGVMGYLLGQDFVMADEGLLLLLWYG